jgi:hypothetical protein
MMGMVYASSTSAWTAADNVVHNIIGLGLNRYAVLGRSSRLWSSVVLDQAFLLALLPA